MPFRKAHGARADSLLRFESTPGDELPAPIPLDPSTDLAPIPRRQDGTLDGSEAARKLGARGGHAKADKRNKLQRVGLVKLEDTNEFKPYFKAANEWAEAVCKEYAAGAGGTVGAAVQAGIGNAAVLLAGARYFGDLAAMAEDIYKRDSYFKTAGRLMDQHRQALNNAWALAVQLGKANAGMPSEDPFAILARIAARPMPEITVIAEPDP